MKFVLIFGPMAVGKMTVGQELEKLTGLPLFHNHMSIELVHKFFEFDTPAFNRLTTMIRFEMFKEVAKSDLPGMIFTLVWALNLEEDWKYVDKITAIFKKEGAKIFFVELEADLEERIRRNSHPHRIFHKPSKKDIKRSEEIMLKQLAEHRFNTYEGEFTKPNYFRIDNTYLSEKETALLICDRFGWEIN